MEEKRWGKYSEEEAIRSSASIKDSLPEWSKGVDSSSTSASCVGSNPTAVRFSKQALWRRVLHPPPQSFVDEPGWEAVPRMTVSRVGRGSDSASMQHF